MSADNQDVAPLQQQLHSLLLEHQQYLATHKKRVNGTLFQQVKQLPSEQQAQLLPLLLQLAGADLVGQPLVKHSSSLKVPLVALASFRQQLTLATLRRQLSGYQPEWRLNNKKNGFRFADALAVRRPELLLERASWQELAIRYPSVVKPLDGAASRGVYLALSPTDFIEVRTGKSLPNLAALHQAMQQDLAAGRIRHDRWQLEELIADTEPFQPARDLKFYCFYGEVGLVLEVDRSASGGYCEWLASGERAQTGRYANQSFTGAGFAPETLELAKRISLEIPVPFIRIDFLKTNKELVFGEFTPRPGKFDEFNNDFDSYLGQLYLAAEARLQKDLCQGKRFECFEGISK